MANAQKINWDLAPAVPVLVLQLLAQGKTPAGKIFTGPMGQQTYVGPVRERAVSEDEWREGLEKIA